MKTFIALIAATSLPISAQAQRGPVVADLVSSSGSACSISSEGGVSSLEYSWGTSNGRDANSGMSTGRQIRGGWDLAVGKKLRLITTPSTNGEPPTVVAHAINTKGMGAGKQSQGADLRTRESSSPSMSEVCAHVSNTKGTVAQNDGAAPVMGGITGGVIACRINPGKGVTIFNPPPPSIPDKVSFQDFHFVRSSEASSLVAAAGPGGGPRVQAIACSNADGAPTSVSMLLLPSVQK